MTDETNLDATKYSDDQPRDEFGRFGSGGGGDTQDDELPLSSGRLPPRISKAQERAKGASKLSKRAKMEKGKDLAKNNTTSKLRKYQQDLADAIISGGTLEMIGDLQTEELIVAYAIGVREFGGKFEFSELPDIDETIKTGNRNNADDRRRIREARAHAREIDRLTMEMEPLDADVIPEPSEITEFPLDPEKSFVIGGESVKALGDGKIGGYLVRFSSENDPDLSGEFFAPDTDFGEAERVPVYYHHGLDATLKKRRIGTATITRDDVGLWAESQLALRDEYERMIYGMAEAGKLGYSSGSINHLVEYEETAKARKIKTWLIGEASLTPTPCEPRNSVTPLKSISVLPATDEAEAGLPEAGEPAAVKAEPIAEPTDNLTLTKEVHEMEITQELLTQLVKDAAAEAIKSYQAAEPAKDTAGRVEVTLDEADRPFKSAADLARAVKSAAVTGGRSYDARLRRLDAMKASGANEGVQSEGGYLVEPGLSGAVIKPIHEVGPFSSRVNRLPTTSSYGSLNGVDETSRANGSRWGGVLGYRVAEAATLNGSKPSFRQINYKLKKYAALMYASDELLMDASQFNAIAKQSAGEELSFMVNDDILNGSGVAGALGILNSGALVTVTRDTASKILHADILAMWQRMNPRNRPGSAWYINSEAEPQLDALYHTTSVLSPYVSYTPEGVIRIKGRPVYVTEFNPALNAAGDILLADMGEYLFWEKEGVQAASSIHLQFLTDEEAFRWTYRCDGQTSMASAVTPYKGTNTQSAFVCLSAAT